MKLFSKFLCFSRTIILFVYNNLLISLIIIIIIIISLVIIAITLVFFPMFVIACFVIINFNYINTSFRCKMCVGIGFCINSMLMLADINVSNWIALYLPFLLFTLCFLLTERICNFHRVNRLVYAKRIQFKSFI